MITRLQYLGRLERLVEQRRWRDASEAVLAFIMKKRSTRYYHRDDDETRLLVVVDKLLSRITERDAHNE